VESESSLPSSQETAREAVKHFVTNCSYGEELLTPRPTPKQQNEPLSDARDIK